MESRLFHALLFQGYGFGAAPKETVESWQEDTQNLLINRRDLGVLKRLFLLVDARRGGPTEIDRTVMSWLEDAGIAYSIGASQFNFLSLFF